jgi:hypothetical protein
MMPAWRLESTCEVGRIVGARQPPHRGRSRLGNRGRLLLPADASDGIKDE